MKRKNLQHIALKNDFQTGNEELQTENFLTAEGIVLHKTYAEKDIESFEHLDFGAGFAPNLRGPYATMYVQKPWTIRQYAGFSTA